MAESLIENVLTNVASSQGLRLVAGSNITPEITLYDATATGSLLDTLGVQSYARIEDKNGRVLARYGEPAPFNLFLAAAYWGIAAVAIFALVKGFRK